MEQLILGGMTWLTDAALLAARLVIGLMFAISGWYKLFEAEEHRRMTQTLRDDGVPMPARANWLVSASEFVFGFLLVVGLATGLAATVLLVIILVAYVIDGYRPRKGERFSWWLSIELMKHQPLVAALLLLMIAFGAGEWSLDTLLF